MEDITNYTVTHQGDGKFLIFLEDGTMRQAGSNLCGMIRYTYFEDFTIPPLGWSVESKKLLEDYFQKFKKILLKIKKFQEEMNSKNLKKQYREWFKSRFNVMPEYTLHGIHAIDILISMRLEYQCKKGQTDLFKFLSSEDKEKLLKEVEIITFEEWLNSNETKKKTISDRFNQNNI